MKIIVDADACPVLHLIEKLCKQNHIPCIFVSDYNHILKADYAEIVTVDKGADSADLKIIALTEPGDLIITQDYGLAALVLAKKAEAIHPSGGIYDTGNIQKLLFERFLSSKVRRAGGKLKGNKKRGQADNINFEKQLREWIFNKQVKNG